ncbi:MAG: hypothetical protein WCR55_08775, partial [Lentisphaerota bacterium]
ILRQKLFSSSVSERCVCIGLNSNNIVQYMLFLSILLLLKKAKNLVVKISLENLVSEATALVFDTSALIYTQEQK